MLLVGGLSPRGVGNMMADLREEFAETSVETPGLTYRIAVGNGEQPGEKEEDRFCEAY
jgi:hypothetical protein